MSDNFISQENKEFIWQMLMDANAFIGIPNEYFNKIQSIYEKLFLEISNFSNLTLKEKNKLVISKMVENIKFFSSQIVKKPLEEVSIDITNEFNARKEEIMELTKHNAPQDISFNDDEDKPIDKEELNSKLNSMIAKRDYDIKVTSENLPKNSNNSNNLETAKKVTFNEINSESNFNNNVNPDLNKRILNLLDIINKNLQLTIQNQDSIISQLKTINSIIK